MYTVSVTSGCEVLSLDDYKTPREALAKWLEESGRHPFDTQIDASTKEEVVALRKFVHDFRKDFWEMHNASKSPYKYAWLVEQCAEPEKLVGYEFEKDFPLYPCIPFTVG